MLGHRFDSDLKCLHTLIVKMGEQISEQILNALELFQPQHNQPNIQTALQNQSRIDELRIKLDRCIVEILSKQELIAFNLRATIRFSKIISELERLNNETVRIAHTAVHIFNLDPTYRNTGMLREVSIFGRLVYTTLLKAVKILKTFDIDCAKKLLNRPTLDEKLEASLRRLIWLCCS